MIIEEMKLSDLDEIIVLENDLFTSPWSKDNYTYELTANPLSRLFVIRENDEIVSYGGMWFLFDNMDITTIGTKKDYQHQGYGQMILDKLLETGKENGCEFAHLEVRVSNTKAISLYEKNGFTIVRTRKGYYTDNHEDAYDMVKGLL